MNKDTSCSEFRAYSYCPHWQGTFCDKVLADPYNVYEHKCLEDRIIYGIWASTENYGYIFDYYCPIICCYVLESDEDNKHEI